MESPSEYARYSHGWQERVKLFEKNEVAVPDSVFLAHAQTEALLSIAAAIEHLAEVVEKAADRDGLRA